MAPSLQWVKNQPIQKDFLLDRLTVSRSLKVRVVPREPIEQTLFWCTTHGGYEFPPSSLRVCLFRKDVGSAEGHDIRIMLPANLQKSIGFQCSPSGLAGFPNSLPSIPRD